jgi:hypothetical protein
MAERNGSTDNDSSISEDLRGEGMIETPHISLTKAETAAVIDYIFQHARGSPNGKAYKVWQKMFAFLNSEIANKRLEPLLMQTNLFT